MRNSGHDMDRRAIALTGQAGAQVAAAFQAAMTARQSGAPAPAGPVPGVPPLGLPGPPPGAVGIGPPPMNGPPMSGPPPMGGPPPGYRPPPGDSLLLLIGEVGGHLVSNSLL